MESLPQERNNNSLIAGLANYFRSVPDDNQPSQEEDIGQSIPNRQSDSFDYSTTEAHNLASSSTDSIGIPGLANSSTVDTFLSHDTHTSDATMVGARLQSQNKRGYDDRCDVYALLAEIMKTDNTNEESDKYAVRTEKVTAGTDCEPFSSKKNVKLNYNPRKCETFGGDDFSDNPSENQIASPKIRMDHMAAPDSPRDLEENSIEKESVESSSNFRDENVSWFHLGAWKTAFAIVMAISAFSLSFACKRSTSFVSLDIPVEIGSRYDDVTTMGLFYIEVCRAEESVSVDYSNGIVTISDFQYADNSTFDGDPIDTIITQISTAEYTKATMNYDNEESSAKVCKKLRLEADVIGDGLWNSTRIFTGLTEWLGGFLAFTMICSCFWKTMNLIPIAAGLFVTYVFQSLSFLFFETELCKDHGCFQSQGGDMAVAAVMCWCGAWIGVLNMIMHERHQQRKAIVIQKKQEIAAAIYDSTRKSRVKAFLYNQISFLKLFGNSTNVGRSASETSMSSGASSGSLGNGRFEI